MKRFPIPKNPRIILLANDRVGLKIARYLKRRGENVVGLILHQNGGAIEAKRAHEIRRAAAAKPIFYSDEIRQKKYLRKIKSLKPDLGISAWFGYLLKEDFIDLFPSGIINFHSSYLPYNRGKYPQVWAIFDGSPYGVSLHFIDAGIDSGDIIGRERLKIKITDTGETLYERALEAIVKLFMKAWPRIKANKIRTKKQDNRLSTHHFAREVAVIDRIDLEKRQPALQLINQIRSRSFQGRTYAYFLHKGKRVYVKLQLSRRPDLFNEESSPNRL